MSSSLRAKIPCGNRDWSAGSQGEGGDFQDIVSFISRPPNLLLLRGLQPRVSEKKKKKPCTLFCFSLFLKGLCSLNFGICSEATSNFLNMRLSAHCSLPYPEHILAVSHGLVDISVWAGMAKSRRTGLTLERRAWLIKKQVPLYKVCFRLCSLACDHTCPLICYVAMEPGVLWHILVACCLDFPKIEIVEQTNLFSVQRAYFHPRHHVLSAIKSITTNITQLCWLRFLHANFG